MFSFYFKVKNIFNWIPSKVGEMGDHSSSKESLGGGFAPVVSRPHIPEDTLSSNTPFDWIKDNEINKLKEWITKVSTTTTWISLPQIY